MKQTLLVVVASAAVGAATALYFSTPAPSARPAPQLGLKAVAKTETAVWISPEIAVEGLRPGEVREGLVLPVVEGLAISGRVTDDGGAPRRDTAVEAWRDGTRACVERTGADGRYVLHVPSEGSCEIRLERWPHVRRAAQAGDGGVDLVVPRPELPGVVEGRVVRKSDVAPVPEFEAIFVRYKWLVPGDTYGTAPEGGDGTFAEEIEEPGIYALRVVADGYATFTTKTFAVEQGKRIDVGTIRLGAPARIRGVVRDAAGEPVPLAQVHVLSSRLSARWRPPFTDRHGRFEHDDLEPDTYTVFAVSPHHPLLIRRDVAAREGETVDLDLSFAEAAPLTLVVLDGHGRPVEGALLVYTFPALEPFTSREVESYEPASWGANRADAEGVVRKPWLPPGPLTVIVEAKGLSTARREVELVAGEETRVEVRLARH
jgi:protocatechuate 3,4-dioxygenase beta subunit